MSQKTFDCIFKISHLKERLAQLEKGEYDWLALFQATVNKPEVLHEVSGYVNPGIEVTAVEGKGRGIVANSVVVAASGQMISIS